MKVSDQSPARPGGLGAAGAACCDFQPNANAAVASNNSASAL
jgi:hypothetical protein